MERDRYLNIRKYRNTVKSLKTDIQCITASMGAEIHDLEHEVFELKEFVSRLITDRDEAHAISCELRADLQGTTQELEEVKKELEIAKREWKSAHYNYLRAKGISI